MTTVRCARCPKLLAELWPAPVRNSLLDGWDGRIRVPYDRRTLNMPPDVAITCNRCGYRYVVEIRYLAALVRSGQREVILGQPVAGYTLPVT